MDLALPDIPGVSVLQSIRARAPSCPVVVVTGYSAVLPPTLALSLGAAAFRCKPVLADELAALLCGLLEHPNAPLEQQTVTAAVGFAAVPRRRG